LPVSNGIFGDRMAGRPRGRIQDGTEARRLLSRLLLGIDGSPVRLWSDEPLMGSLYQRLCPAGEDYLGEPIVQSTWRAGVHCLGSMGCFWLAKLKPDKLQKHELFNPNNGYLFIN
jgi:hypothetical protein